MGTKNGKGESKYLNGAMGLVGAGAGYGVGKLLNCGAEKAGVINPVGPDGLRVVSRGVNKPVDDPWYKSLWFIGLLILLVVSIGVGLFCLLSGGDDEGEREGRGEFLGP